MKYKYPGFWQVSLALMIMVVSNWCMAQQSSAQVKNKPHAATPKVAVANKFPGEKFTKSWNAFVQAVNAGNTANVKKLSTECVYCNYCLYNSDKENQVFVDSMKKNADAWTMKVENELQYLPSDKFLKEDFSDIFSATTKPKLSDKASLNFRDGDENRKIYRKICISSKPITGNQKLIEVVVATHQQNGSLNKIFTFIEEKDGYKFCGFSTLP